MSDSKVEIERVRFERGQTLAGADMRAQVDAAAHLRWWHNRALHEAFGVVWGLLVSAGTSAANVRVSRGVAHDAFGRELLLRSPRRFPLPQESGEYILLLRYPQSSHLTESGCRGVGELAWQWATDWSVRDGVPLASIDSSGNLHAHPWAQGRARARARPRIASGTTLASATSWSPWSPVTGANTPALSFPGFQTVIDTSSAGFSETPCYFAWLEGPRMDRLRSQLLAAREHLEQETPQGFAFCLWLPALLGPPGMIRADGGADSAAFFSFARTQGLSVRWLAIEPGRPHLPED